MSFTLECPFCSKQISVPDEMAGQTAPCPSCGQEVYLDDQAAAVDHDEQRRSSEIRAARAAMIAAMPSEMPRVTMSWAFDFVLKITLAALVVDGILGLIIGVIVFMFKAATRSRY